MSSANSLVCHTHTLPWEQLAAGVETKRLTAASAANRFTTSIVRLAPGTALPSPEEAVCRELLVIQGMLSVEDAELQAFDYTRQLGADAGAAATPAGATLLMNEATVSWDGIETDDTPLAESTWGPGHGSLMVKLLHASGTESAALVRWPAGERFIPHRHFGGEEIFVLSGTFMDEHGVYPAGTWIQSPHLSSHHPFVEEETVIFVKTGHLREAPSQKSLTHTGGGQS